MLLAVTNSKTPSTSLTAEEQSQPPQEITLSCATSAEQVTRNWPKVPAGCAPPTELGGRGSQLAHARASINDSYYTAAAADYPPADSQGCHCICTTRAVVQHKKYSRATREETQSSTQSEHQAAYQCTQSAPTTCTQPAWRGFRHVTCGRDPSVPG